MVVYAMRQLIVLCLLTVNLVASAKIANDTTGLKGLKELLEDGTPQQEKKSDLVPDATETEPVEQDNVEEESQADNKSKKSIPRDETRKNNDRSHDDFLNSDSEYSHDRDESKKVDTSPEFSLGDQDIHSQLNDNGDTPEEEDPVHSVSIADLVLNFRKGKLLKSKPGSNNTRHRHHHHHHSKPHTKPAVRSRFSEKSYSEPNESRSRNTDRRNLRDGIYPPPDGFIVEEGAEFGNEYGYPHNNMVSIVHRSVIPALPQRSGCLQCHSVPMALRKNMNPPINYYYAGR